jgi:hypothetical protein
VHARSCAYVHHLLNTHELLGFILLAQHNLEHYLRFFAVSATQRSAVPSVSQHLHCSVHEGIVAVCLSGVWWLVVVWGARTILWYTVYVTICCVLCHHGTWHCTLCAYPHRLRYVRTAQEIRKHVAAGSFEEYKARLLPHLAA